MPELIYLANNRLPTEKAHGLQIAQMCEAFAETGYTVTLVTPRRINTPDMCAPLWDHYGIERNFAFRRLPCLDLFRLLPPSRVPHAAFLIQTFTYLLALGLWLLPRRPDVFYTRDLFIGLLIALTRPRSTLAYEVHQLHRSRLGRRLQAFVVRRAYVIPVTGHLAGRVQALGARRVWVEHDGWRAARFEDVPSRDAARAEIGIPTGAFVVGYVGRLHTMQMSKGLDTLIDAIAQATGDGAAVDLLLVGGPEAGILVLREQWTARGLPPERLHAVGQVPPEAVPRYLAAMDVGALPLPWTEHFAYFASAIKLFEYMATGCTILASDLPSTAEVVRDGESALLVPPGDVGAFAAAIQRLWADRELVRRLGAQAHIDAQRYTWRARAERIKGFLVIGD
jgi:glycosyltransferase involved in cell wall biosynthesis